MPAFIRTTFGQYVNIDHIVRVDRDLDYTRISLSDDTSTRTREPLDTVMRHISAVGGRMHTPVPDAAS